MGPESEFGPFQKNVSYGKDLNDISCAEKFELDSHSRPCTRFNKPELPVAHARSCRPELAADSCQSELAGDSSRQELPTGDCWPPRHDPHVPASPYQGCMSELCTSETWTRQELPATTGSYELAAGLQAKELPEASIYHTSTINGCNRTPAHRNSLQIATNEIESKGYTSHVGVICRDSDGLMNQKTTLSELLWDVLLHNDGRGPILEGSEDFKIPTKRRPGQEAHTNTAKSCHVNGSVSQGPSRLSCANHGRASLRTKIAATEERRTQPLVEELRFFFQVVCEEWGSRLSAFPKLLAYSPKLSIDAAFNSAILVVREFTKGNLPTSLESLFLLMHIAVACAFKQREDRDMFLWDDLFLSIMDWQWAMGSSEDRVTYVRLINKVMGCHHTGRIPPSASGGGSLSLHSSMPGLARSVNYGHDDASNYRSDALAELLPIARSDIGALWSSLEKGKAMVYCWEFLEDVAHAEVVSRPLHYFGLDSTHIFETLTLSIISQLRAYQQMDLMSEQLAELDYQIRRGQSFTPHELEVALLRRCQDLSDDPAHVACHEITKRVCDQHMAVSGPAWRNLYRKNDLVVVLAVAAERRKYQDSISLPTYEEALAAAGSNEGKNDEVRHKSPSKGSTPSHPYSSTASFAHLTCSSGSTSPPHWYGFEDTASQHDAVAVAQGTKLSNETSVIPYLPTPPSSQGSPRPATERARCPICTRVVTKSNLQRHKRDLHGFKENLLCPVSECKSTFSRLDRVGKHIRLKHSDVALQRQGVKRRRT